MGSRRTGANLLLAMRRLMLARILITCALALGGLATHQTLEGLVEPRAPALVPTDEAISTPPGVEEQSTALPLGKIATGEHLAPNMLPLATEDHPVAPSDKAVPSLSAGCDVVPVNDELAQIDGALARGDGRRLALRPRRRCTAGRR